MKQIISDKLKSKAFALPFDLDQEHKKSLDPAYTLDLLMSDPTAQNEKEELNPNYLGQGHCGVAAIMQDGRVVKYVCSGKDQEIPASIHQQRNNFPCIIKIHEVKQIQKKPELWRIIKDKATILSPEQEQNFWELKISNIENNPNIDIRSAKSRLKNLYDESFLQKVVEMFKCLKANNIHCYDIDPRNIGISQDKLVLFDLGTVSVDKLD